MEPFAPSLEKLLLKNLPGLKQKQLDDYTSISTTRQTAFSHWLFMLVPPSLLSDGTLADSALETHRNDLLDDMKKLRDMESEVFFKKLPYKETEIENAYNATHEFWAAKRRFALEQGNFVQLPYSSAKIKSFVSAAWNYRKTQFRTLKDRWHLRLPFRKQEKFNENPDAINIKKENSDITPDEEKWQE